MRLIFCHRLLHSCRGTGWIDGSFRFPISAPATGWAICPFLQMAVMKALPILW